MASPQSGVDTFAVERGLRSAAAELLFAPPRTVRRLLRRQRDDPLGWRPITHRGVVILDARRLAEVGGDLIVAPADIPPRVAVVARPDTERLVRHGPAAVLREYWRLSFHALLDLAAGPAVADGRLDVATCIGPAAFAEARDVLVREGLVDRDAGDAEVAAEFAATFLELRCFAAAAVADWFPALEDPDDAAVRIAAALAAEDLLARTLPPGLDPADDGSAPPAPDAGRPAWLGWPAWPRPRSAALRRRADRTARTGNLVRALLDEWRAVAARPASARPASGRLDRLAESFGRRLAWALDLDAADCAEATWLIRHLVERAAGSSRAADARVLYDLQKVCVDSERESFRTQLLRWLVSAGARPLAVPLPCQRLVLIHRHAIAAADRLATLGLSEAERRRGGRLLAKAARITAEAAREALQPAVERALHDADLRPRAVVEEAAAAKLVDELLDIVVERGFVSFGSVRDAVSRNQLKLDDLTGVREWVHGDELLRLDRRLAAALDGVYRPAPFYLAMLQRLSSPFFGVGLGRLLTTHLLVPLGGAWILLRGLEHVVEPVSEYAFGTPWQVYTRGRMLIVAGAIWALIHLPAVRRSAWQAVRAVGAACHFVGVIVPARILRLPMVARVLRGPPVRWFLRHAASPLLVTLAAWLLLPHHGGTLSRGTPWLPPVFFAVAATLLNSAVGRQLQEQVLEAAGRLLHQLHVHVVVGLFAWILDGFRWALDMVEAGLYAVDETLRFRSDESGLLLAVKAVLGAVWSVIESGVRFCVTLLIEPQLNPIKHFPVVTVSHKLLVPMIPVVASQLVSTTGMERGVALTAVTFVSTALPGVFGFLAWELKENWRLYAANRPRNLRPVPVGHHGETVRRLLLPGFHSGTVPKLFAKLRRGDGSRATRPARRGDGARDHLEHAVADFLNRDVIALLERTPVCAGLGVAVADVRLAVNRIGVDLSSSRHPDAEPLVMDLVRRGDGIESLVVSAGWLERIDPAAGRAVRLAIAGYHRFAAADTATAAYADLPPATTTDTAAVPLAPIAWTAWRDAWEAERSQPAFGRSK